jgi:hypothetical protein
VIIFPGEVLAFQNIERQAHALRAPAPGGVVQTPRRHPRLGEDDFDGIDGGKLRRDLGRCRSGRPISVRVISGASRRGRWFRGPPDGGGRCERIDGGKAAPARRAWDYPVRGAPFSVRGFEPSRQEGRSSVSIQRGLGRRLSRGGKSRHGRTY